MKTSADHWWNVLTGETETLRATCPSATSSITNRTWPGLG